MPLYKISTCANKKLAGHIQETQLCSADEKVSGGVEVRGSERGLGLHSEEAHIPPLHLLEATSWASSLICKVEIIGDRHTMLFVLVCGTFSLAVRQKKVKKRNIYIK